MLGLNNNTKIIKEGVNKKFFLVKANNVFLYVLKKRNLRQILCLESLKTPVHPYNPVFAPCGNFLYFNYCS